MASKYGAIKTDCAHGHRHDSKLEAGRCDDLCAMEEAGIISHLIQQPQFKVEINGKLICKYRADFQYRMRDSGLLITLDVKGMTTPIFNLKRKMVEAMYPGMVVTIWPPVRKKKRAAKKKA